MKVLRGIAGLLVTAATIACSTGGSEFYGSVRPENVPQEDFTLTDQYGEPFRLADHRGKVVLLFFGYAHCPDICPVTLSNWARVEKKLGSERGVEFVFVTVDPERDTAEKLREHLAIFSATIRGLTGTEEEMARVYERLGIFREKRTFSDSAMGYVVDHTSTMLLLDREGRVRVSHPYDGDPDEVAHDVRRLLRS